MKPAAIAANLVNMRNVATHGSVALTLHVPQEHAQIVLAAFGWPTMAAPVPVAIARLEERTGAAEPVAESDKPPVHQPRGRHWSDLAPAQQTGVIRNEPAFWEFTNAVGAQGARDYIRAFCGVGSCGDILPGSEAAARWAQLQVRYGNFLRQRSNAA